MPITLGLNISSIRAQSQLAKSSSELSNVFERLSSGQRINKASDDAAGLAIADSLNADTRVYTQGIRNLNDGLSVLNIADGALAELTNITFRLTELAEQAANGVYSDTQRAALDNEAQALSDEYFRITQTTEYNGQKLFTADYGELRLQAGYGLDASIGDGLGGAIGTGEFQNVSTTEISSLLNGDIVTTDLNGDGNSDLITIAGSIQIQLGNGDGTFGQVSTYSITGTGGEAAVGDLDGDGNQDLVVTNTGSGQISVFSGDGSGAIQLERTLSVLGTTTRGVTVKDINGDGRIDIGVVADDEYTILENDGEFEFRTYASGTYTAGGINYDIDFGDFNDDGEIDLVVGGIGGLSFLLNNGEGRFGYFFGMTFIENFSFPQSGFYFDIEARDIDGDGFTDVIASDISDQELDVYSSANSYVVQNYASLTQAYTVDFGDIDGNGTTDILSSGSTGAALFLGIGDGTFASAEQVASFSGAITGTQTLLDDLNNDGVLDALFTTSTGGTDGDLYLYLAETQDGVAPLLEFSLTTIAGAREALSRFTQKLDQLSTQRGEIGAFMSRIEVAESVLQVTVENYKSAESRIRDADIAGEAADLVRLQILQQSGAAVLGQANLQPQLALQLLGGIR